MTRDCSPIRRIALPLAIVGLSVALPLATKSLAAAIPARHASVAVSQDRDTPWTQRVTQAARELCGVEACLGASDYESRLIPPQPSVDRCVPTATHLPAASIAVLPTLIDLPPPSC
ncbi:MAG: hypothetical protein CMJ49_14540 [Planctomycetaceae bacterium]|nr:hypothetical protein [Planctomycetaceae bacterium]